MSDDPSLEERYFNWLYSHVGSISDRDPATSRFKLLTQLHRTPFDGFFPNDQNRAENGRELRYDFIHDKEIDYVDQDWLDLDCSIFEMLIALSGKAAYNSMYQGRDIFYWFWLMLDNLEIGKYVDRRYHRGIERAVADVLDRLNRRDYEANGRGGLFPLRNPPQDQTEVEVWYQLSSYLIENEH